MRLHVVWTDNDEDGYLEEHDELLGPDSTVRDLKGLIKMWTDEGVQNQVIVIGGKVCENDQTLREVGLDSQAAADAQSVQLMLEEDAEFDAGGELSHEDFIRAQKALGKGVRVTKATEHQEQLRREAYAQKHHARARPAKLMQQKREEQANDTSEVYKIFEECRYGMRIEGVDEALGVMADGERLDYWDLRLPEDMAARAECDRATEVVLEIFFFGEIDKIPDKDLFKRRIVEKLADVAGVRARLLDRRLRDAGCMYPLTACHVVLSHRDAERLGRLVFEHFGVAMKKAPPAQGGKSGKAGGCGTQ